MVTIDELTKGVLGKLYLEELLTETQIAERYGTSQTHVGRLRQRWGIPTLGKTGRLARLLPPLTELQDTLLYASLLGDGGMEPSSEASARFSEHHSEKQVPYLEWKAAILRPYVSNIRPTIKRERGRVFTGKRLETRSCPQLRPYYDLFYPEPDRKRVFPPDLYKRMAPFVLAVWYMDDGSIVNRHHARIHFGLCETSLERAKVALARLGLHLTVEHENDSNAKALHILTDETDKFFNLVRPHIPSCMAYKIPPYSKRRDQDANAAKLTTEMAREMAARGLSKAEIARRTGVGTSTVERRLAGQEPARTRKKTGRPAF